MIDQAFIDLKSRSLVDWGVVLLGVQAAFGTVVGRLDGELIEGFATSELAAVQSGDAEFDAVAALALDSGLPVEDIEQLVGTICQVKSVDIELSKRKWRAALVADALNEVDSNPLYGCIQLSEIWSNWGWPDDGPKSMRRGSKTTMSDDFGSPEAFFLAKQETEDWLASEYSALSSNQYLASMSSSNQTESPGVGLGVNLANGDLSGASGVKVNDCKGQASDDPSP